MKEIPDREEPSRTRGRRYSRRRAALPLLLVPAPLPAQSLTFYLLAIGMLLVLSLFFSALRAAHGVVSTSETPWERRNANDLVLLSSPQKLILSLFQRVFTLFVSTACFPPGVVLLAKFCGKHLGCGSHSGPTRMDLGGCPGALLCRPSRGFLCPKICPTHKSARQISYPAWQRPDRDGDKMEDFAIR